MRPAPQRHVLPATSRRTATGSWFAFTGASVFPGSGASSAPPCQSYVGSEGLYCLSSTLVTTMLNGLARKHRLKLHDKKPTDKQKSSARIPPCQNKRSPPCSPPVWPSCSSRPRHPRRVGPTRFRKAKWPATSSSPTREFPKPTTPGSPCMSPPGLCWTSIRGNAFKPACSAPGCSPGKNLRLRSNSIPTSRAAWAGGGTRSMPRRRRSSSWAAWRQISASGPTDPGPGRAETGRNPKANTAWRNSAPGCCGRPMA